MKPATDLMLYWLHKNEDAILVITQNGTFAELDCKSMILTSTGEAISPEELPKIDDPLWFCTPCYPDSSIVI